MNDEIHRRVPARIKWVAVLFGAMSVLAGMAAAHAVGPSDVQPSPTNLALSPGADATAAKATPAKSPSPSRTPIRSTPASTTQPSATQSSAIPTTTGGGGSDLNERGDEGINNPWLVALLGGAAATLILDRAWAWWTDRSALRTLLVNVRREVEETQAEARLRKAAATDRFEYREDLPMMAWTAALNSGVATNLIGRRDLYNPLNEFYSATAKANHDAAVAAQLVAFALGARGDDSHDDYMDRARRLTSEPYAAVDARADSAIAALQKKRIT